MSRHSNESQASFFESANCCVTGQFEPANEKRMGGEGTPSVPKSSPIVPDYLPRSQFSQAVASSLCGALLRSGALSQRAASTAASAAATAISPPLMTDESAPELHTQRHVGMLYRPADADYPLMRPFMRPELPRLFDTLGERALLVRQPAIDMAARLRQHCGPGKPVIRFLLYGMPGSGKSLQASHVSTACRHQGWLVVSVHTPHLWLRCSPDLNESDHRPGMFDTPKHGCDWLRHFYAMNQAAVDGLSITKELRWNAKEATASGATWKEVIDFALTRPRYSCAAVQFLVDEIKLGTVPMPTLVVFEVVNCLWWHRSGIKNVAIQRVPMKADDPLWRADITAKQLTLLDAFKQLLNNDWQNGAAIISTSPKGAIFDRLRAWMPRTLLGDEGFAYLDPFVPVHIEPYAPAEMSNVLNWYSSTGWLSSEAAATAAGRAELTFLSGGNAAELMRLTGEW